MRYTEKKIILYFMLALVGVVLCSCTANEPTVETPKTYDQYLQQAIQYYNAERHTVDSCKVGYNKGDFAQLSVSSFAKYKLLYLTLLSRDSAVIFNKNATIEQLIAANSNLNGSKDSLRMVGVTIPVPLLSAGKNFWSKINVSDRRPLNDLIVSATSLNTAVLIGTGAGTMLQSDKNAFTNSITAATAARDAAVTIDRQVQTAINLLNTAITTFQAAIIPASIDVYVQNSGQYIAAQKSIVQNSIEGYNIGEYLTTLRTNYLNAILSAETIVNTQGVTYLQLSTSLNAMVNPRNTFIPNVADKRSLNDSIVIAETYNNFVVTGSSAGQVSQSDKVVFNAAIISAKSVRDNAGSIDGNVKKAIYNLYLAKTTFNSAILK